jgi:hypothetical protein
MMGVAIQVSRLQAARTNWKGTFGILNEANCKRLIEAIE